jgi:putative endonuclease
MQTRKYPCPSYLVEIFPGPLFAAYLKIRARNLRNRDKKRGKPVALKFTVAQYREQLYNAIVNGGRTDPYTGDAIDWTLVKDWDASLDTVMGDQKVGDFNKALYMSPAVDHVDPDSDDLELEICTWIVNACKSELNPTDFIALCVKVTSHRLKSTTLESPCRGMAQTSIDRLLRPINTCTSSRSMHGDSQAREVETAYRGTATTRAPFSMPRKYLPPPWLENIFTVAEYEHLLDERAEDIYRRDLAAKRPYALAGSKAFYKEQIHKAIWENGEKDPYTGDTLDWTLVGKWDSRKNKAPAKLSAGRFSKAFYLLPVVDHIDPNAPQLAFEICSWIVNECKSDLNPADFVALCARVTSHRLKSTAQTSNNRDQRPISTCTSSRSMHGESQACEVDAAYRETADALRRVRREKTAAPRARKRKKSRPRKKPWYLYILECGDGSLYTGISNDVEKRLTCHQSGKGAKYTKTHQPVKLMYVEKCGAQGKAMSREREVKRYPKKKKLALFSE